MSDKDALDQIGSIKLGDLSVKRLGLGTNRIHDNPSGHELLKKAVELGINFIDTAHTYAGGESEAAIGKALTPYKPGLIIATKGGMGNGASASQLRAELQESLQKLRTNTIDLYQLHRVDPTIPLLETMKCLKQFKDEGLIRHIGLSEVSVEQLQEAMSIVPIISVQNEYNIAVRKYEDLVDYCTSQSIIFIPWFPLGGLRGDTQKVEKIVDDIANHHQAAPQQIALAWLLKRSPIMLPIPGTTSIEHLESNLKSATIELSKDEWQKLGL